MDPRTASHVLTQIAALLELSGENRFRTRAYEQAARAVLGVDVDDLEPLLRSGELERVKGLGPGTVGVLRELIDTGESTLLERLRARTPEGLVDMLRVPGLGTGKISQIHAGLGVQSLDELEAAARDGRLAALPRFGPKTAERILRGIAFVREQGAYILLPQGLAESERLADSVRRHPDVLRAEVAGSVRRRREVVCDVDIVAACSGGPAAVAASFARQSGVKDATGAGTRSVKIRYVDGARLDLHCVTESELAVALFRATGSTEHVAQVRERAAERGLFFDGDTVVDARGASLPIPDEAALYAALGLQYVEPELREGRGEIEAAAAHALPTLVAYADLQGVLHCHSDYSDGKASIAAMAQAAKARGWHYLGISDHSESAFYAGGLSRDAVLRQHDEIDALNASWGAANDFRVLKGIEADILQDGRVDYDAALLDRFDYVIGSIHSRFAMDGPAMTQRALRALDDPHLTILGHPTGRLLLTREPYDIDLDAVIDKAADVGVAIELNADPHRLDVDWRHLARVRERGATIEIGPDAHSTASLDWTELGVALARKGWMRAADVLNARSADEVVAFAKRRRSR